MALNRKICVPLGTRLSLNVYVINSKIPKEQSEGVNRRTDNINSKRKRTNGQTMIYKAIHRKLMIEQHEPH